MDKGAHFHKCDLQLHTPRDEEWVGLAATTEQERKEYADELIRACREKGLNAIAITDHHDFVVFPYVRKAAQFELDESGKSLPDPEKLTVFPGIELTLTSPACQALLILDAEFPENLLESVLTALAISPAPVSETKHAKVERIPHNVVGDLSDLYKKLNNLTHLRGRFIVLPNVSDGHGTLLRQGFANFYKDMPCVGGYTDGPITNLGTGNLAIVRGEHREYGNKAIAVFQTSDNRRRDHESLGSHATWVKWSEPTAEALRQACLAKESRLTLTQPELPSLWISSISVSHSKFLGRLDVDFNQQYNAVIGGRGTGKSTILEYLRWGLCDQPLEQSDSEIIAVQERRGKLIEGTLQRFEGEVVVTFYLNDVKHIVKRSSKTHEVFLRIGSADLVKATEQQIRDILPIQAYSQKQLSSVGIRIEELRRFVELPIKQRLDEIRSDIRDAAGKIRASYVNVIRKRELERDLAKHNLEIASLSDQSIALRKALKGLSKVDEATIDQKTEYDNEELIVDDLQNELVRVRDLVEGLRSDLGAGALSEDLEIHNKDLIQSLRQKYSMKFSEVRSRVAELLSILEAASLNEINADTSKWRALKQVFDKEYDAAKARAHATEQQLGQIKQVETRIAELKKLQAANRSAISALGDPETHYKQIRSKWNELHALKAEELQRQCREFSTLSERLISADVKGGLDADSLKRAIKAAFTGLNIRELKIDELCKSVLSASDPIAGWNKVLDELELLVLHKKEDAKASPQTEVLDACGFIESEKARLVAGFDANRWLDLSLTELELNPVFTYCTNQDTQEYIAFSEASAGQQATALLTVLLGQSGPPLIIDQPEDDIDSKMSSDIVQRIWHAKRRRQLIFASHHANFVVNGDAELVICCDYIKAGDQTGGRVKITGAIDNSSVREEITTVTEGGKAAFKLRRDKYGF